VALSEFSARKAKPREKHYKITDGGSLHLLVQTSGSKLWRLKYRFDGKEKLLSFGLYTKYVPRRRSSACPIQWHRASHWLLTERTDLSPSNGVKDYFLWYKLWVLKRGD